VDVTGHSNQFHRRGYPVHQATHNYSTTADTAGHESLLRIRGKKKKSTRARFCDNFAKLSHINILTATGDMEIFPSKKFEITRWQNWYLNYGAEWSICHTELVTWKRVYMACITSERKEKGKRVRSPVFDSYPGLYIMTKVSRPQWLGFSAPGASHHNVHPEQKLRTLKGTIIYCVSFYLVRYFKIR